jgi:hypothetical protein
MKRLEFDALAVRRDHVMVEAIDGHRPKVRRREDRRAFDSLCTLLAPVIYRSADGQMTLNSVQPRLAIFRGLWSSQCKGQ